MVRADRVAGSGTSFGRALRRIVALAAVLCALTALLAPTGVGAQTSTNSVVYEIDVEAAVVNVTTTFDPDLVSDIVELAVPAAAVGLRAESSGVELPITPDPANVDGDFWAYYSLDARNAFGPSQLTYRIPSDLPRTYGFTRINPAHVEFYVLPDPAFGSQDVTIVLPDSFRAYLGRDHALFEPGLGDGTRVWHADSVSPFSFQVRFIARDEAGLVRETVDVGSGSIEIAAWADDTEWQKFARTYVGQGVPVLADLVGSGWPQDDLVVIESTAPYEGGAGGWFSSFESEIEVGDFLDETIMLHELSHAWFNGVSLEDTWMIEGFAEHFSALASAELNGSITKPDGPQEWAEIESLVDWGFVALDSPTSGLYYEKSWYVIDQLAQELGNERLAEVVQVMLRGEPSYAVPGDAATMPSNDWRRFLDVLEETGGSTTASELFAELVVNEDQLELLQKRSVTRDAYAELKQLSAPYATPSVVRDRMSEWSFSQADLLIADATDQLTRLQDTAERADRLGLELPDSLIAAYEDAAFSFGDLEGELADARRSLRSIEEADPASPGLADARDRFERGIYGLVNDGRSGVTTSDPSDIGISATVLALLGGSVALGAILFAFGAARSRRGWIG